MKNNFGKFRLLLPSMATSSNNLLGSAKDYGNHCASYKIISVTLKRSLKTQIFDKED